MRRRCVYTETKYGRVYSDCHGWLIAIAVSGSATFYFIETRQGLVRRIHEAYSILNLVPEDTPFSEEKEEVE